MLDDIDESLLEPLGVAKHIWAVGATLDYEELLGRFDQVVVPFGKLNVAQGVITWDQLCDGHPINLAQVDEWRDSVAPCKQRGILVLLKPESTSQLEKVLNAFV